MNLIPQILAELEIVALVVGILQNIQICIAQHNNAIL